MKKIIKFKPKGMNRDLSKANFSPEFSYENKNIRFTTNEANSLMSITNERGPALETRITTALNNRTILGHSTLEKNIIIFCKSDQEEKPDHIIVVNDEEIKDFAGNLEFDIEHPIEAISIYENENVQKVYWTDGKNPPRVLNICNKDTNIVNNHIDFVPDIQSFCDVEITKDDTVSGHFPSGTMQYAFTYINVNGSESNIFYTSPLFYIVYNDRGASPEESVSTGFKIQMQDLDPLYKYVRIYSITRTSKDAIPVCKRVIDLYINKDSLNNNTYYIDNGLSGDTIDPTELLYVGGEKLIAQTISHKDNTLFLGNIKTDSGSYINLDFKSSESRPSVTFTADKRLPSPEYTGYYSYKNNLNKSNWEITTFKYNEWYRFGLQAQSKNGKWSEPVWINDCRNTTSIKNTEDIPYLVTASFKLVKDKVNSLVEQGYTRVRPIIVYPSIHDRECICQGVVCPTVYNAEDRRTNSPWAQASWVFRPEPPTSYTKPSLPEALLAALPSSFPYRYEHDRGIGSQAYASYAPDAEASDEIIWNYYISGQEIQGLIASPAFSQSNAFMPIDDEYFFIDRSIITLNSPDIEFNNEIQNLDLEDIKFRIVGEIPIHANYTDMNISTKTAGLYKKENTIKTGKGLVRRFDNNYFNKEHSFGGFQSGFLWNDYMVYSNNVQTGPVNHLVYMWHREGQLNDTTSENTPEAERAATLDKKKMSVLRASKFTKYHSEIWMPEEGISGAVMFNMTELGISRLPAPKNSLLQDIVYYGNIEKIVNITTNLVPTIFDEQGKIVDNTSGVYSYDKKNGYPLFIYHGYLAGFSTGMYTCKDPTLIKYKSSPHIALSFNRTIDKVIVLPTREGRGMYHPANSNDNISFIKNIGENSTTPIKFDYIKSYNNSEDILWVGELYRDNISNRFGGTSEEALQNNSWLPCGESVELVEDADIILKWVGGDTFYQRYDCMKTYPFTFEDRNQLTDILSFMCETRVNIDGRYDRNRGSLNNFSVSPTNFNLINPVYTQQDNFFNYRIISDKDNRITDFPSTVTWSKTKTAGEKVDTWTNITLASTLDLDGDKGLITSLQRFNNQIIAFQDKGISQILYNENMQISTESGVPIEIANSGKVNGKRYITNNIGCQNKWSICSTPSGIYFIDDYNKSINLFAGEVIDLSKKHGFNSWINSQSSLNKWNPKEFDNFVTFYDNKNKDVLFINNYTCLAYSEVLGQFTSFYDYNKVFPVINILGNTYLGRENKVYLHNEGDYNKFFDAYKPFYIEVIANENPTVDKIFTNIEFTSDTWNNDGLANNTFDILTVHNEYQQGSKKLSFIKNKPSSLKRKFRLWRADIPRDSSNNRDRMRNTWLNLKLEKSNTDKNTDKTVLHDLSVYYHI